MSKPVFVVVGNVNRGKSSIVATLAADDSVVISALPGTTKECREFPMRLGEETLYTLIDTPGFERPRHVLAWLKERSTSTEDRRRVVEQFVQQHEGADEFLQERTLLKPILDGAAILYVVDGSKPFSPKYEAEMEVLRWTAQPRMALINPIESEQSVDQWRSVLDQYFNIVREFDAHQADFDKRVELLRALRELNEQWRAPLDRAITALKEDRQRCYRECGAIIANMLADMLSLTLERSLSPKADPEPYKVGLKEKYYQRLRKLEHNARQSIKEVYQHRQIEIDAESLGVLEDDLFARDHWGQLGLRQAQLIATGFAAGALAGGVIDAGVGGASFMAGAVLGGALGGSAAYYGSKKLPEVALPGWMPVGGAKLKIGPMTNPQFPWVVLDRALLFHRLISHRAHARRDKAQIPTDATQGLVQHLPKDERAKIERHFMTFRGGGLSNLRRATQESARQDLAEIIAGILGDS